MKFASPAHPAVKGCDPFRSDRVSDALPFTMGAVPRSVPLVTGDPADVNRFKQPTLWGIKDTAPYFHDNSPKTLEDVLDHYDFFLRRAGARFGFTGFTAQDKADIIAFLKLL